MGMLSFSLISAIGLCCLFLRFVSADDLAKSDAYQLVGFQQTASIPVLFPKDICIFKIDNTKFAGCLQYTFDGQLQFTLYKEKNASYVQIYESLTPLAISMDCISMGSKAYIILVYNLTEKVENIVDGSPLYEITQDDISAVQFFTTPYQESGYLRSHESDLYLLQTHQNVKTSEFEFCPIYKWSGYHFNFFDRIPCQNAKHVEPFFLYNDPFVMVANFANLQGDQHTISILYKYVYDQNKFIEHQRFKTAGAVDVKHFRVENEVKQKENFLVIANTINNDAQNNAAEIGAPSIIYKYENGIFVPIQKFHFHTVTQFLPVYTDPGKFLILVACKNQETTFLQYDGRHFQISNVQLTEGALGKGVSTMRTFQDVNNTYIVIANERMSMNETNIYLPLYKSKENYMEKKLKLLERCQDLYNKQSSEDKNNLYWNIENAVNKGGAYYNNVHVHQAIVESFQDTNLKMTKPFWKTMAVIKAVLSKLEEKVTKFEKISKNSNQNSTNVTDNAYTYDTLSISNLTVTDQLDAASINNKSQDNIVLNTISADSVIIKGRLIEKNTTVLSPSVILGHEHLNLSNERHFEEINAKEITVTGSINGIDLSLLDQTILKNVGNQIISTLYNIDKLKTTDLKINGLVSGVNISKLVTIDKGDFAINQDIKFIEPVEVNQLVINDRLNHINIVQGRLDVFLKNSDQLQVIGGSKIFESVQLMEPILLQGKIKSSNLEKMNPIASIKQDLILQGDYVITGDVTIDEFLSASNFYGQSKLRSVQEVLDYGLPVTTKNIELDMHFLQPIRAYRAKTGTINDLNSHDFVSSNSDEEQEITGHKTFRGDLNIRKGSCDVQIINKVDFAELNQTRLQKYGDQNITGILFVRSANIKSLNSSNPINLNGTNFNDILTTSTEQSMTNEITIENVISRNVKIQNLTGGKKIFNQDIDYLIKDSVRLNQSPTIFGHKHFTGNVRTDDLILRSKINDHNTQEIEKTLNNIIGDININEDIQFDSDIKIERVIFEGEINGIPNNKFGYSWLLSETDQEFTAPQHFEFLSAENIFVNGLLNGYQFNDLVNNVYWIDREEQLENATFTKLISHDDFFTNGKINGYNFAENVLLKESANPQILHDNVTCIKNIFVNGRIRNLKILNNIDLIHLQNTLDGKNNGKLTVDAAVFENYPTFNQLNGHDLKELSKQIWFKDQDAKLEGDLTFEDVEFLSHLKLKGPINGVNVDYLNENYFSLTKEQNVNTLIHFKGPVILDNSLSSERMELGGVLVDRVSHIKLNITDFATGVLRNDIEQEITAQWQILKVINPGNLDNVLLNGYRLFDDVMRYDVSINNITAPKQFESATVMDLYCGQYAKINNIDMLEWISNAVYSYGNYTIHGTNTFDDIQLYNDVTVLGTVNGIKFDEKNLLLKNIDQVIYGNVEITTKFEKDKRILPLTFENLETNSINGIEVAQFFTSIISRSDQLTLQGSIVFQSPTTIKQLHSDYDIFNLNDSARGAAYFVEKIAMDFNNLTNILKHEHSYLSHFELQQSVPGKIRKILKLAIPSSVGQDDVIAVLRGDNELYITFHKWSPEKGMFLFNEEIFSWLAKDSIILDCNKIRIQGADILVIETFNNGLYYENFITSTSHNLQMIFQLSSNQSQLITPIEFNGKQCFLLTSIYRHNLMLNCMDIASDGKIHVAKMLVIYTKGIVLQAMFLKKSEFAISSPHGIELWNLNMRMEPIAEILIMNPTALSYATFDNYDYLAISTFASIEIYRAPQESKYEHFQSINATNPLDIKFSVIPQSNDFLLYTLSQNPESPFTAYTYRGISGFQNFLKPLSAKFGKSLNLISLAEQKKYFFCYIMENDAIIVEAVFKST